MDLETGNSRSDFSDDRMWRQTLVISFAVLGRYKVQERITRDQNCKSGQRDVPTIALLKACV